MAARQRSPTNNGRAELLLRPGLQPSRMSKLLLTFYGDDFTGSTDALEQLTLAGIRTALFIAPPTPTR